MLSLASKSTSFCLSRAICSTPLFTLYFDPRFWSAHFQPLIEPAFTWAALSNFPSRSKTNMLFDDTVPIEIHMWLWSTTGVFKKLVTIIWNGTFAQTSYMARVRSIFCVSLAVCISLFVEDHTWMLWRVMWLHFGWSVDKLCNSNVHVCSVVSSLGDSCDSNFVTFTSSPVPKIAAGTECTVQTFVQYGIFLECFFRYTSFWVRNSQPGYWRLKTNSTL